MGKYACVKIEYYIISQTNEFVNRFYEISQKYFLESLIAIKKGSFNVKLPFVV